MAPSVALPVPPASGETGDDAVDDITKGVDGMAVASGVDAASVDALAEGVESLAVGQKKTNKKQEANTLEGEHDV